MPQVSKQIIKDVIQTLDAYGCGAHHPDLLPLLESKELTQERLKELIRYDATTGLFTWAVSKGRAKAGCLAGSLMSQGYIRIRIDSKKYLAHRLAWLFVCGEFPKNQIDHINGIKDDNCFANLRECSNTENQQNTGNRIDNTSGFKGVGFHKITGKWQACAKVNGKRHHLGLFLDKNSAHEAHESFVRENHGEFFKEIQQWEQRNE
jgi:hypothetical protein